MASTPTVTDWELPAGMVPEEGVSEETQEQAAGKASCTARLLWM